MVNFALVIERIEKLKGISGDKHIAALLGISPQDFSNRKKRGTLLPIIFEWAIHENVNLDWLMKGEEPVPIAVSEDYEGYRKPIDPVIEKIHQHLEQMSEADRKAVEQITATLAQSQKVNKKAG